MKNLTIFIAVIVALSLSTPAAAAELDTREHIEVTGSAEVKVVPDEFVIRATVQSFDSKLEKASRTNEEAVRKAFVGIKKLGVDRRYIVTDEVQVNAVTEGYRERGNFKRIGFTVSRNITVVLHDSTLIQPAIKRLFAANIDRLTLSTGSTEMEKHLKRAQKAAAKDARAKATTMSTALGQTPGRPVAIIEMTPSQNPASNFVYSSATPDLGDSLSLGKLKVRASVRVKFLLE